MEDINHPRRLAQDHPVSATGGGPNQARDKTQNSDGTKKAKEPEAQTQKRPNRRTEISFQRIKDNNKRYRPLKHKVISESEHALTLANGSVLRKSGVAEKAQNPSASDAGNEKSFSLPKLAEMKQRIAQRKAEGDKAKACAAKKNAGAMWRPKSKIWDDEESESESEGEHFQVTQRLERRTSNEMEAGNGLNIYILLVLRDIYIEFEF